MTVQFFPAPGHTMGAPPTRKRGAIPTPRNRLSAAVPYEMVAAHPPSWAWIPGKLSYWLNNQYGDCVTAEEAAAKAMTGVFIDDDTVRKWASGHDVLDGAMLDEVLDWMAERGFLNHDGNEYRDGGKQSIDWKNRDLLCNAIAQGPVKIGVAADQLSVVQGKNGWVLTGADRDQNEDHSVTLCGYGTMSQCCEFFKVPVPRGVDPDLPSLCLFTWDTIGTIDQKSMENITGEAWLRVPTTIQIGDKPPDADPVWTPTPPTPPPPPPPGPGPTPYANTLLLATSLAAGTYLVGGAPAPTVTPDQVKAYMAPWLVKQLDDGAFDWSALVKLVMALLAGAAAQTRGRRPDPAQAEKLPERYSV